MAEKTFVEIFGFEPKRDDCVLLEDAIVRTILTEFADKVRNTKYEIANLIKGYSGTVVENLVTAREDLKRVSQLSDEKKAAMAAWVEAKEVAEQALSMKFEGGVDTFYSKVM